ncbi:hypothetical protein [Rhizobium leguminosarum]|uniref:hypothetical protein n=1 Tax=Rhizobium leguminosarum TaxID=384 RepID=UPI001558A631|nr:hypothetical protein [Rhizobium leguminosarum]
MIRFPALAVAALVFICRILEKIAAHCVAECGFGLNTTDVNGRLEAVALKFGGEDDLWRL